MTLSLTIPAELIRFFVIGSLCVNTVAAALGLLSRRLRFRWPVFIGACLIALIIGPWLVFSKWPPQDNANLLGCTISFLVITAVAAGAFKLAKFSSRDYRYWFISIEIGVISTFIFYIQGRFN